MAKFTDNQNREWAIAIDIPIAKRIRKELQVNILDIQDGVTAITADPILFCDVLFLLCEAQAKKLNVTDEEFGRALTPSQDNPSANPMEEASDAVIDALIFFSPQQNRETLRAMQTAGREMRTILATLAKNEIPRQMDQLKSILGLTSPGSKESSDSNQPELCET